PQTPDKKLPFPRFYFIKKGMSELGDKREARKIDTIGEFYRIDESEGNEIGKGSFGKVFKAVHLDTGTEVAIKVIDKEADSYFDQEESVQKEIAALFLLPKVHNVMQCYEVLETDEKIYIVCELFEGEELFALVKHHKRLNEGD